MRVVEEHIVNEFAYCAREQVAKRKAGAKSAVKCLIYASNKETGLLGRAPRWKVAIPTYYLTSIDPLATVLSLRDLLEVESRAEHGGLLLELRHVWHVCSSWLRFQ